MQSLPTSPNRGHGDSACWYDTIRKHAFQIQKRQPSVQSWRRCHSIPRLTLNMAARTISGHSGRSKWRRRKSPEHQRDDDDCGSLGWLLNFRLDELVNFKVPYDQPAAEEVHPSVRFPEIPPAVKKPPYTYPELIERALRDRGELTVSAMYQWISDRFPYYKSNDERWKNSVRHNLSINPHFRKGTRASQGAGHLWSLAANAIDLLPHRHSPDNIYVNEKMDLRVEHVALEDAQIMECPKVIVLDEAAIAAANIISDNDFFTGNTIFLNPVSTEQVVRECGLLVVD